MKPFILYLAEATPATPDNRGHDLTWPYWVAFIAAFLIVIVIPFIMGWRKESDRQIPRENLPRE